MSQVELADDADISAKHLSFLETGRSRPSRQMLIRLMHCLTVPLHERNRMLRSAGFAPAFGEHSFFAPALAGFRRAVEGMLDNHGPVPALAVDRHCTVLAANKPALFVLGDVREQNIVRLCLHPSGLAPRIVNLDNWRAHIVARLRRQIDQTGDPVLVELLNEIRSYPNPRNEPADDARPELAIPLRLATAGGVLSFFTMTATFDAPLDIAVSELAIEAFVPADDETIRIIRRNAGRRPVRLAAE